MRCGASQVENFRFCSKCGNPAPKEEKRAKIQPRPGKTAKKAVNAVQQVSSTVSKMSQTVQQASSLVETAEALVTKSVTVTPPPKWTVVVGDILPKLGEDALESAVQHGVKAIRQQAVSMTSQQMERASSGAFSASGLEVEEEQGMLYCSKCGASNKEGFRFCRKCGTKAQLLTVSATVESSAAHTAPEGAHLAASIQSVCENETHAPADGICNCARCHDELEANAMFCGKCGAEVEKPSVSSASLPAVTKRTDQCPKCNAQLKMKARFCGKCGTRIGS